MKGAESSRGLLKMLYNCFVHPLVFWSSTRFNSFLAAKPSLFLHQDHSNQQSQNAFTSSSSPPSSSASPSSSAEPSRDTRHLAPSQTHLQDFSAHLQSRLDCASRPSSLPRLQLYTNSRYRQFCQLSHNIFGGR